MNPALPANAVEGLSVTFNGAGLLTVNVAGLDTPPPGAGLVTVTLNVPTVLSRLDGIVTLIEPLPTSVGVSTVDPNVTVAPATNDDPVIVIGKFAAPAVADAVPSVIAPGNGLTTPSTSAADVPPPGPGLVTVTPMLPVDESDATGTVTCNVPAVTAVGINIVPPSETVDDALKPEPLIVNVGDTAVPTTNDVGVSVVATGKGFVTVKVSAFDAPPVGAGFVTVTLNVPVAVSDVLGTVTVASTEEVTVIGEIVVEPNVTLAPVTKLEPLILNV